MGIPVPYKSMADSPRTESISSLALHASSPALAGRAEGFLDGSDSYIGYVAGLGEVQVPDGGKHPDCEIMRGADRRNQVIQPEKSETFRKARAEAPIEYTSSR